MVAANEVSHPLSDIHPPCPVCGGSGTLYGDDHIGYGNVVAASGECESCGGAGVLHSCWECGVAFGPDDAPTERSTGCFICARCAREVA